MNPLRHSLSDLISSLKDRPTQLGSARVQVRTSKLDYLSRSYMCDIIIFLCENLSRNLCKLSQNFDLDLPP